MLKVSQATSPSLPNLNGSGAGSEAMGSDKEVPGVPFSRPSIGEEEIEAVVETLRSGWLTTGPQSVAFEERFAAAVEARFAVAVTSATAGLHLGLDALGVGVGDEVLVPTLTFASTAATVLHTGANLRLVDCEPGTLNLSVADAERRCTSATKAIVPVHFGGHPCDLDEVAALAASRNLAVMEDAAHALPARYRGRFIGSISPLTVFSFYATKNLTTGEGGMITTGDEGLRDRLSERRLHGMTRDSWKRYSATGSWRYDVSYPGFKYNMTDICAAIGLVQLRRLGDLQKSRLAAVERYFEALSGCDEIELPACRPDIEHAWHLFIVRVRPERLTIGRDRVIQELNAKGIGTSVHFIPLHEHSYYRDVLGVRKEDFPHASAQWERIISLPLFASIRLDEVDRVADTLLTILHEHRR